MISESNSRTNLTPNWLSLMNTSVDNLPFDVKLDKAKIGLDPATIKFLPLILKTLKKNKYFDKIMEDTSSQNPYQDKTEPKDYMHDSKNIFSDTRNWMRMSTPRLYAVEYKTSPIIYFKNPTRNIDYFTKVRKIRDYQRIMNYVDKMINERVTFGSTVPMNKYIYNKNRNLITTDYTTPMTKIENHEIKSQNTYTKKVKTTSPKEKPHCSCPKRMNELLHKLINSLQKLLPNYTVSSERVLDVTKSYNHITQTTPQTVPSKSELDSSLTFSGTLPSNVVAVTTRSYRPQPTTTLPKVDYTLNSIIALLKPSIQKKNMKKNKLVSLHSTTIKNYIEGTDGNYKLENTTETIKNMSNVKLSNVPTSIREYILNSNSNKITKYFLTNPKEYEDYAETTPSYVYNYKTLDPDNLELIKRIKSNTKGQKSNQIKGGKRFFNNNLNIESKNALNTITEREFSSTITATNNLDIPWETSGKTFSAEVFPVNISNSNIIFKNKSLTNQAVTDINKIESTLKSEDITLEEEIEKTSPEDVTAEENMKNLENIIKTLNNSNVSNKTEIEITSEDSELYEWELVKIEDNYGKNDIFAKSMIPEDRASYLEIQRNDWKQDEHQDYDNNINHYLF